MPEAVFQLANTAQGTNQPGPPPALPIHPGIFPRAKPEPIMGLSRWERNLSPQEEAIMRGYFGKSLSPDEVRMMPFERTRPDDPEAFVYGERTGGPGPLPGVIFYNRERLDPEAGGSPFYESESPYTFQKTPMLPHEMFHVWQNLAHQHNRYKTMPRKLRQFFKSPDQYSKFWDEIEADQFARQIAVLTDRVEKHPVYNQQTAAEMAFLDSVRDYIQRREQGLDREWSHDPGYPSTGYQPPIFGQEPK
jgi:hypothetical protein